MVSKIKSAHTQKENPFQKYHFRNITLSRKPSVHVCWPDTRDLTKTLGMVNDNKDEKITKYHPDVL